jgi:hypothetical protein
MSERRVREDRGVLDVERSRCAKEQDEEPRGAGERRLSPMLRRRMGLSEVRERGTAGETIALYRKRVIDSLRKDV